MRIFANNARKGGGDANRGGAVMRSRAKQVGVKDVVSLDRDGIGHFGQHPSGFPLAQRAGRFVGRARFSDQFIHQGKAFFVRGDGVAIADRAQKIARIAADDGIGIGGDGVAVECGELLDFLQIPMGQSAKIASFRGSRRAVNDRAQIVPRGARKTGQPAHWRNSDCGNLRYSDCWRK